MVEIFLNIDLTRPKKYRFSAPSFDRGFGPTLQKEYQRRHYWRHQQPSMNMKSPDKMFAMLRNS